MGLGLWRLTPLSTIFQLYRGGQFEQNLYLLIYILLQQMWFFGRKKNLPNTLPHNNNNNNNRVIVVVFNATFNSISVIRRPSVLLVEKTGVPGENHQPAASR